MIRKATINDLETIVKYNISLAKETEDFDLDYEIVKKGVQEVLLDQSKGYYFVYEENNIVIGQLLITFEWSDWRCANFWWIQSVYVHKDYRKKKIFTSLYNFILEESNKDKKVCGLRLYVEKNNINAQKTYSKLGMKESHYYLYESKKS